MEKLKQTQSQQRQILQEIEMARRQSRKIAQAGQVERMDSSPVRHEQSPLNADLYLSRQHHPTKTPTTMSLDHTRSRAIPSHSPPQSFDSGLGGMSPSLASSGAQISQRSSVIISPPPRPKIRKPAPP